MLLFAPMPQTECDSGFQAFWREYPVHKAKADAEKAWRQVNGTKHAAAILAAIEAQKRERLRPGWHPNWKHPASWLRARCWEDEVEASSLWQPSASDLRKAGEIRRRAYGRCPHEPACPTYAACVELIAREKAKGA